MLQWCLCIQLSLEMLITLEIQSAARLVTMFYLEVRLSRVGKHYEYTVIMISKQIINLVTSLVKV